MNAAVQSPCTGCTEPCCRAVKHLPYQGETDLQLFSSMLIGAFPDFPNPGEEICTEGNTDRRRFLVTEWLVPAEAGACLAWNHDGLCSIYPHRPLSCRQFPLNSNGSIHPFCSMHEGFHGQVCKEKNTFAEVNDRLDLFLLDLEDKGGRNAVFDFFMDDGTGEFPLLYNAYLLALLILAGGNVIKQLESQEKTFEKYKNMGLEYMTFIIPGTEYCIGAPTESLHINLMYLIARIHEQDMCAQIKRRLERVMNGKP